MSNIEKGLKRARAALHPVGAEAAPPSGLASSSTPVFEGSFTIAEPVLDFDKLEWVDPDPELLERNRIVMDERSTASAGYKVLRTRVLQRMKRNGWKTLAVTGTCPGEGKSLTAINLAINLARHVATSVVLVDLDLRSPALDRYFGIDTRYGVLDFLSGDAPLTRVAVRPGLERLAVVLNDRTVDNSSELLSTPEAGELVEQCKRGEDRIAIFDLPPVFAGDDVLAFAPLIDAVLLVFAEGLTTRRSLVALRELLQNINVIGSVLNRSSEDVAPYYYGDRAYSSNRT
jgi:Mrp family chromosome partitioning ATPase